MNSSQLRFQTGRKGGGNSPEISLITAGSFTAVNWNARVGSDPSVGRVWVIRVGFKNAACWLLHRIVRAKSAAFGCGSVFRTGAPRSMKLGTIRSPWHYDAAARHALQSVNLRRPAPLHYTSRAAVFPISQGGPVPFR